MLADVMHNLVKLYVRVGMIHEALKVVDEFGCLQRTQQDMASDSCCGGQSENSICGPTTDTLHEILTGFQEGGKNDETEALLESYFVRFGIEVKDHAST